MNKEKIKNWLKNKHNLIFVAILALGIIIRLYYFILTKSQPLWWDEADYLAYAKNLAGFDISWIVTAKHNSLYPFLIAAIFKVGLGEITAKFLFQFIPSTLSVIIIYFLAKEMYKDLRIAAIASFLMSVFWISLFNTARFHIDILGFFFGLLALYVFWKGYEKKEKIFGLASRWAIPLSAVLIILSYAVRRGYFLFGLFILIYVVITKNWKSLIKDKYNWTGLVIGIVLFFFIENTIFSSEITAIGGQYFHEELPINFLPLGIFESFFKIGGTFNFSAYYLAWAGLLLIIGTLALSLGHIRKSKGKLKSDLFNFLIILITLAFFIIVLRTEANLGEPRWYLPMAFSAFVCIARSTIFIVDFVKGHHKTISVILLLVLILPIGYYQLNSSNDLIEKKVNSFSGIKDSSLLLKEISNKEDKILTMGQPQVEYYSERKTVHARKFVDEDQYSEEHFFKSIEKLKGEDIRYVLITFSEPGYPSWMTTFNYNENGQIISWEIPFMDTKIDFATGQQQILQTKSYGEMTFNLIDVKQEVFIYEIIRN